MPSLIAFTRAVPPSIVRCELTHVERLPIDVAAAEAQHQRYEDGLRALGCTVERVDAAPDLPDSVFVEDTAIVLDEVAIVTRPGAASRRPELDAVAGALQRYRRIAAITEPATVDGGDVLVAGRRIFVGISGRTNAEGTRQIAAIATPLGYTVEPVAVQGCLHLKSAATAVAPGVLLCNPEWVNPRLFDGMHAIAVAPGEPSAANVLRIGSTLLCAAAHVRTAGELARRGYAVHAVDVSEFAKAEGAITCCSLVVLA